MLYMEYENQMNFTIPKIIVKKKNIIKEEWGKK